MSILDKIKDKYLEFENRYKEKTQNAEDKKKDLLGELDKERDDYFNKTVGDVVTTDLSRVSDDDIKTLAEKYYQQDKAKRVNKAEKTFNDKKLLADSSYSSKQSSLNSKLNSIGEELKKDITNQKEKNLKNNVARSSIASSQESQTQSEADKQKHIVEGQLEDAKAVRDAKVQSAQKDLLEEKFDIDYDFAKPIADKQNELQALKDKNSSYARSLVNKTALKDYDEKLLSLIDDYVLEVGAGYANEALKKEGYLEKYLSSKQIKQLKEKYGW